MRWNKLGKLFSSHNKRPWMHSHASLPFVDWVDGTRCKIYFSARDRNNHSLLGWILVDMNDPFEIIDMAQEPVLLPGAPGFFDENGIMGCQILNTENEKFLYYIGWNLGVTVPFRNALGLAINDPAESVDRFRKYSAGPVLDRSIYDPCFVASSYVIKEDDNYRMWYLSCIDWQKNSPGYRHFYHIKYAESKDGVNWKRDGRVCIGFSYPNEYAISRPCVLKEDDIYKMWYSYRGGAISDLYRIGYAESKDGYDWRRKDDEAGIDVSSSGWDADMICYPYVFKYNGKTFMLYNGNDYGKTGFGLAVLED